MTEAKLQDDLAGARTSVVVQVWWGDCLLHGAPVAPGLSFSIGQRRRDFPVCKEVLGSQHERVVVHRGGEPFVWVAARAQGSLRVAGADARPLGMLRREPAYRAPASEAVLVPLAVGTEVQLELGALMLRIWRSAPDRAPSAPLSLDLQLVASLAASALATLMMLVLARQAMPPLGESVESDVRDLSSYVLTYAFADDLEAAEEESPPSWRRGDGAPATEVGQHFHHHDGLMGARHVERSDDRYGVQGPQDNPDPHIARERGDLHAGWPMFGFIPASWGAHGGPIAPWGRDDSLGTDALSARGHMWGEEIAPARGADGMGGVEVGGRPQKVIVSTVTDVESGREPPRVLHTGLQIDGPLRPSAVLPIVASRFDGFQSCYAVALAGDAELEGRVDLVFTIDMDGAMAELGVGYASVAGNELPACLLSACGGLSFPRDEGGSSRVRYPLLFDAGKTPLGS